jgi:hypothetical protein
MMNRNLFNISSRTPTTIRDIRDINEWSDSPTPRTFPNNSAFKSSKLIKPTENIKPIRRPVNDYGIKIEYVSNSEVENNSFFSRQMDTINMAKTTSNLPTYFGVSNTRKSTIENMIDQSVNSSRPQIGYSRSAMDTNQTKDPSSVFTKDYSSYISK